jgi:hypothetical protein
MTVTFKEKERTLTMDFISIDPSTSSQRDSKVKLQK